MREATSKQVEGERNKMASCTSNTNGKKKKHVCITYKTYVAKN